jgi:precorrin-2 dehydrogenase / sirohydrochlorin ferrochelatase
MNQEKEISKGKGNELFPVFFKLEKLNLLMVGGGAVGLEKAGAVFRNSPQANVTLVAPEIRQEIIDLAALHPNFKLIYKAYEEQDLDGMDLVIAATANHDLNLEVHRGAKKKKILVNVADTPDICDFYLSSIVQKGNLKIAISTNGQSPTLAKRIREVLEDALPEEIDALLDNLKEIRAKLKGDFEYKVNKLNEITSAMKENKKQGFLRKLFSR